MSLQWIDWLIIILYFVMVLVIGLLSSKQAGKSSTEFFLSGRNMPWWLLGLSMVATTFSTDTPNLVTDIVRTNGVSGNWVWWAFLLTGMLTVFVYAKLWRRSSVMTDVEFYEIRYSGKPAAFLRGFRAIYLGVFFNVMIMGTVSLAAIKIGSILLDLNPLQTILIALVVTVIYSGLGGLRSVLITDAILFVFAVAGSVIVAVVACKQPQVGGLTGLFSHPNVEDKLHLIPIIYQDGKLHFLETLVPVLVIPIAVQWWSVWYPGSEPGGGGFIAQRMLAAKDEKNAMGATLFFNACHYALRPWPWILVALASLIIFPDLNAIQEQFPHVNPQILKNDIAYPAMLSFLPAGLLGIVLASLIAAYMSTMSTHLNWGASYLVNDFYKRFINPTASEKKLVNVGRISTVGLMILVALVALSLQNALQAFHILLQIGAGTGLIFILRWFWWRINAWTELAGMVVSFVVACYLEVFHVQMGFEPIPEYVRLVLGVAITTCAWLAVTLCTKPSEDSTLRRFYRLIRPGGPGWDKVLQKAQAENDPITETAMKGDLPRGILCMVAGCLAVYSAVFAVGFYLYTQWMPAIIFTVLAIAGTAWVIRLWDKLETK